MNASSESKLVIIHPKLAAKIRQLDEMFQLEFAADPLAVIQGFRNYQDQAKLYAKGRTTPGEIVTNAPPGHSWHEFGLAVDVCPQSLLDQAGWAPDSPMWARIAAMGESLGLVSGSCWHNPDRPHLQLTGKFGVSPNDQVRTLFLHGGMQAVWDAAEL